MTETSIAPFADYFRFRLSRDTAMAVAWFGEKWGSSLLFKLAAFAFAGLIVVWVGVWMFLASDLPEAEGLADYQTPLPTVVRGIDGEIVHSYARERRVQLQYADFPNN